MGWWRSALYPEDWHPGLRDERVRFLHDFSYAGYHRGQRPLPDDPPGRTVDVTQRPYRADPTGSRDVTGALQRALDDVGAAGGGVVYLPEGTYRVRPPEGARSALRIWHSGVVLRGAGPRVTRLFNDEPAMHARSVVRVAPADQDVVWHADERRATLLSKDINFPTAEVPVEDTTGFSPGDWVVVRGDATEEWIAEHGMTGKWTPAHPAAPQVFRRVVNVGPGARTLTVDAPTRYPLLRRDRARVHTVAPPLTEVGIEGLSIGMRQSDTPGMEENGYQTPGTGAYDAHYSFAVYVNHVVDGWIRDVATFRPEENEAEVHLLSNGIMLQYAARITVRGCVMADPQYRGGGGNGYLYALGGSDCLVVDCEAVRGRHNYAFLRGQASGNVLLRCILRDGLLGSDFHMHLSPANLIDSPSLDGEYLDARYRPYGTTEHGQTTSQSVFWNVRGLRGHRHVPPGIAVISQQFGWGYVIGTSGPSCGVALPSGAGTEPVDYAEGLGTGDTLEPQSLYEDQLRRRLGSA